MNMSCDEKINILLVDDRPENLLALEAIIESDDRNLIKAFSGEEALKYLLKYDFAAILLDVQMPGIDGFGTAKIIKAREKTKNIPILFITANNMDSEHIFTGYSIGAIDYILKPFDPIILKAKVEGFVELYKMNQTLFQQAEILTEKKRELENAYTELSKTTSELRVSEALANVISETSIDSMIIIDNSGLILKVNPAVEKMFLYDEKTIIGKNISVLFSNEIAKNQINHILEAINNLDQIIGYENLNEVNVTRKDGTSFPAEIQIGKRYVQDRCIVACTIRDITKKKQYQEMISHMAYHDGLTDLPNRRYFNDQLNQKLNHAKQTNQSFALMYLDMDRFKYINDSLGHNIGDKVLQEIANRLTKSVRESDFVARVGGDEFNILLPDTNRENALDIAENIIEAFKSPFYFGNYELFITTCIGVSVFPFDGDDPLVLVKNADAALYRAKEQGKNNYKVFHSGMNIQSYRTFIMQNELRKAIEREEFLLVYQPRIDIETGTIKSAEALIRWEHPSWGTILPSEFIPLAEETGQIVEIGEWVLKSACKQNKIWQDKGLAPIRIAVNFSAQQFLQKDLIDTIKNVLIDTAVSPNLLEIEITESVLMGNETTISNTLNQLRKIGIFISIDDFGTGYSSLSYLRRFPLNTLKIDKSFIRDISTTSSNSNLLISTIISLAHSLNMSVIAEGVETEEQLNTLRKLNCEEIQGYLFSPPVLPKEFEDFLIQSQDKIAFDEANNMMFTDKVQEINTFDRSSIPLNDELRIDHNKEILNAALNHTKELYSISNREMDVFRLIVNGLSNKEISDQLFISEHTVKNHITHIFQKLTVNDRLQAMAKVYQTCIEEGKNLRVK
ncbi:EAL domain-containing protein [Metabacillus bambusae]|uniref:EAL domain-containing protein n=1 Tax=Metabacillus bambusae TaxID=2795218 RepID=A0ABS3MW53_9BACI|nr:EAL domain-containing protein [Metabacillus bambusae]MBO1510242.1 EAL domain-containing protein [Metabacillus bambusae]